MGNVSWGWEELRDEGLGSSRNELVCSGLKEKQAENLQSPRMDAKVKKKKKATSMNSGVKALREPDGPHPACPER